MALRRPPTAYALKASDVADLEAALERRNRAAAAQQQSTASATDRTHNNHDDDNDDVLLRREREEQLDRERKGQRARVMGA